MYGENIFLQFIKISLKYFIATSESVNILSMFCMLVNIVLTGQLSTFFLQFLITAKLYKLGKVWLGWLGAMTM